MHLLFALLWTAAAVLMVALRVGFTLDIIGFIFLFGALSLSYSVSKAGRFWGYAILILFFPMICSFLHIGSFALGAAIMFALRIVF